MSELDYKEVAEEIAQDRPEGFKVRTITVNFEMVEPTISEKVKYRASERFEHEAGYILNHDLTVIADNSLDELWTYSIIHHCGREPMYDSKNREYYCPFCENQSVFNY